MTMQGVPLVMEGENLVDASVYDGNPNATYL